MRLRTIIMAAGPAAVLTTSLAMAACNGSPSAPIDAGTFVKVMVDLRRAERQLKDSLAFDARKEEILREAGVTDSMLMAFVRAHRANTEFLSAVWDSIDVRVNPPLVAEEDTAR